MRAAIVGAGIAGLTVALCLSRSGHDVLVLERAPRRRPEGYMLDFFGPGYDAADRLGLLPALERVHYPIPHLVTVDRVGRVTSILSYTSVRRRVFADRHFNFMRGDLERVLFEALGDPGVVRYGAAVASIREEGSGVVVTLGDGREERADLLVGADGFHSTVRKAAFEDSAIRFIPLRCHTAAFVAGTRIGEVTHDAFSTLTTAGRSAAAYPIRGHSTAAFFVHDAREAIQDRSPAACRGELEAVYRGRGELFDRLLDAFPADADVYFDDVAQVAVRGWHRGRIVLVGDSCGCVSLVAGQGASMAMAGAYVLAEQLHRSPRDLPRAFETYERRMRPAIEARQRSGRRNAAWFLPGSDFAARLRDRLIPTVVNSPLARLVGRKLGADSLPPEAAANK
jgi:2-polyprenyl-6-methoxyphenol hydroxylase-like FAD-dependent oxidoreductase